MRMGLKPPDQKHDGHKSTVFISDQSKLLVEPVFRIWMIFLPDPDPVLEQKREMN